MANADNLQKAQIIRTSSDRIYIKHPTLEGNQRTYLTASFTANGTTLTVKDNNGFVNAEYAVLGYPGNAQSEECQINASVTRGTSLTIAAGTKFNHDIDTPITQIVERQVRIKGADTLAGSQTTIATVSIQWDKPYTEYINAGEDYAFYFVEYSDGTLFGEQSDGVASDRGLGATTAESMIRNGLKLAGNEQISTEPEGLITREWLIEEVNNWQDDITSRRDWSFETFIDDTLTSTEGENEYAVSSLTNDLKHPNSNKGIISVKFGKRKLDWMDYHDYEDSQEGVVKTTLASAVTAGDTTATVADSNELASSSSVTVGSDTVDYTSKDDLTGVLSGIPASGTGSFASNHSSGDNVWQNVSFGKPEKYTIYNDKIYLDRPVDSTNAGIKINVSGHKVLPRLTDFSDTTDITFAYTAQYFIAGRIEYSKGNHDKGDKWFALYDSKISLETRKDRLPTVKRIVPIGNDTPDSRVKKYKSTESSRYNY